MRIYLDNCCFNRPYDFVHSEIIRMEAEAKLAIQSLILDKQIELAWSFILTLENDENPFDVIRKEIADWQRRSIISIDPEYSVESRAGLLEAEGIKPKDAAHLACAIHANCAYFITTDRKLIKKARALVTELKTLNPIEFLTLLEGRYED